MIDLVFKNHTSQESPGHSFFEKVLKRGAKELELRNGIEVSVNLVGETKMRELNKKYRRKDKSTDVLSFPLGDGNGDIFICLSIAKSEAKRENITIKQKLARLTVHGFLHLLGYDHEKSKHGAKKMLSLERRILQKLSF